jgi:hypothetical protein
MLIFFCQVIIGFQQPKPSTGSHKYVCTYAIIDQSTPHHSAPTIINMFSNSVECFPYVTELGDVIRIHRAHKDSRNNRAMLTCWADNNKSSTIIFKRHLDPISALPTGDSGSSLLPDPDVAFLETNGRLNLYSEGRHRSLPGLSTALWRFISSTQHVTFTDDDANTVQRLHQWGMQSLYRFSLHDSSTPLTTLQGVTDRVKSAEPAVPLVENRVDLICLVVTPVFRSIGGAITFNVWDGSLRDQSVFDVVTDFELLSAPINSINATAVHSKGWPADFTSKLSAVMAPGSDLMNFDANSIEWYHEYISAIIQNTEFRTTAASSILGRSMTVSIEESAVYQHSISRIIAEPGAWIRLRNALINVGGNSSSDPLRKGFLITVDAHTHVNKFLPYCR